MSLYLRLPALMMVMTTAGCLTDQRTALLSDTGARPMAEKLSSWVGHSFSDVVTSWGEPTSVDTQPDGGIVASFEHDETREGDGSARALLAALGADDDWQQAFDDTGEVYTSTCVINFQFNSEHRVVAAAVAHDGGALISQCFDFIKLPPPGLSKA